MEKERKAEQHRVLMDLAQHFGYIVLTPAELSEMVLIAAAKRSERVEAIDSALNCLEEIIKRAKELEVPFVTPMLEVFRKDLKDEIALRSRNV
jgi:hypothetical protein